MTDATFYSVGDSRYFLGVVGLVNSLRLCGHREEIVILDAGFTPGQRLALANECTVIPLAQPAVGPFRMDFKLIAPSAHSSDIAILIDGDIIVTGRLDRLIDSARRGHIAAHPDPDTKRWFAEWQSIFDLPRPPRHDVYVCAGLVAFSKHQHPDFLDHWTAACKRIPPHASARSGPFAQADQDALNALLFSAYPRRMTDLRPAHEVAQARELRLGVDILDRSSLTCKFEGNRLLVLHAAGTIKPWFRRSARKNAYTALLTRLLLSDDVPIRVPSTQVPIWLRSGPLPSAYLTALHAYHSTRRLLGRRIRAFSPRVYARLSR